MGLTWASYYSLARVNESGPEVKNWAVTDTNWQIASLLFKQFEGHHHTGTTPIRYPGFNPLSPATPATPNITVLPTGGFLSGGTSIGLRMSFTDQYGLETDASPEKTVVLPPLVNRPNAPTTTGPLSTPVPGALRGGTYVFALTKRLGTGESTLSDVLTVDVPLDATGLSSYVIPLNFDPINLYTDGTDSLCLYRTTGFDSAFVLVSTFAATPNLQNALSSYSDDGTVQDVTHQPPQASEFGKQNMLAIDWTNISIPSNAYTMRFYVTQQSGVWGTQNLLQEYQLVNPTTPFPTSLGYLGTEVLSTGYPIEFTQVPFTPPPVNLTTEAIGAPVYTTNANAQGYQTWNFVLPDQSHATPIQGNLYVDKSTGQLRAQLSATGGYTTVASGSGYDSSVLLDNPVSYFPLYETSGNIAYDVINRVVGSQVQNLVVNPAFQYDTLGQAPLKWQASSNLVTTTLSPTVIGAWGATPATPNARSVRSTFQFNTQGGAFGGITSSLSSLMTVTGGSTYTASALVNVKATPLPAATPLQNFGIAWYGAGSSFISNTTITTTPLGILPVQVTAAAPANATGAAIFYTCTSSGGGTFDFYLDDGMFIAGSQIPYFDGDQSGALWLGAPGNSVSEQIGPAGLYLGGYSLGRSGPTNDAETAVTFDGITGNVLVPSITANQLATPFTVEGWINPPDRSSNYTVLTKGLDYRLFINNVGTLGRPKLDWNNGQASIQATTPIPINAWTHLAATYDGAIVTLLINGLVNTSSNVALLPSKGTQPLAFGSQAYTQVLTNLVPNPSFEYDTVGAAPAAWAPLINLNNTGAVLTCQTSGGAQSGSKAMRVITNGSLAFEGGEITLPGTFVSGTTYTLRFAVKGNAGGESIRFGMGGGGDLVIATATATTSWQWLSANWTPSANRTGVEIFIQSSVVPAATFFVDAVEVAAISTLTSYNDGDSPGWQWTGTAGNSISVLGAGFTKGLLAKPALYKTVLPQARLLAHVNAASQNQYIHPMIEATGGHTASNIQFAPQVGGPTMDQIGSIIATPVAGGVTRYRKQVQNIYKVAATPVAENISFTNSAEGSTYEPLVDMDTFLQWPTGIQPDFPGQWFDARFESTIMLTGGTLQNVQFFVVINGVPLWESLAIYGWGNPAFQPFDNINNIGIQGFTYHTEYYRAACQISTPLTRSNNRVQVYWQLTQPGTVTSVGGLVIAGQIALPPTRYLKVSEIF